MKALNHADFRFYGELNDFLPPERRMRTFSHAFEFNAPVKDMVEGLGVPHTEIDLILVNGESVNFSFPVRNGDRVSVFPVFESLDITPVLRVRPRPLRVTRFVADIHLGKLAIYLRALGFDTQYQNDLTDHELAALSAGESRILLTRDVGLLKHGIVTHGYFVRETNYRRQAVEVVQRFDLSGSLAPFTRCLICNQVLELAPEELVVEKVPLRVRSKHTDFRCCRRCGRVYWKGSHYKRMQAFIESILEELAGSTMAKSPSDCTKKSEK